MAITEKLDQSWETNKAMDSVFEFRAVSENVYNVLQESITRIDEIAGGTDFQGVDLEIKSEGQVIRQILNQAKESFDQHQKFLNWTQPESE